MPRYEVENWGEMQNQIFAKGIITAVDSENDTADVAVDGYQNGTDIPLFYHCSNDAEERSNGAIEGAAAAFSAGSEDDPEDGDQVIVMVEADTGTPIRVIGFAAGIKVCGYHEPFNGPGCLNNFWVYYCHCETYDPALLEPIYNPATGEGVPPGVVANLPQVNNQYFYCDSTYPYVRDTLRAGFTELSYVDCIGPDGKSDVALQYHTEYDGNEIAWKIIRYYKDAYYQWERNRESHSFSATGYFYKRKSESPYVEINEHEVTGWGDEITTYSFNTISIYIPLLELSDIGNFWGGGGSITIYYTRLDPELEPYQKDSFFSALIWSPTSRPAEGDEDPDYQYDYYGNPILNVGVENVIYLPDWDNLVDEGEVVETRSDRPYVAISSTANADYDDPHDVIDTYDQIYGDSVYWEPFSLKFQISDIKLYRS